MSPRIEEHARFEFDLTRRLRRGHSACLGNSFRAHAPSVRYAPPSTAPPALYLVRLLALWFSSACVHSATISLWRRQRRTRHLSPGPRRRMPFADTPVLRRIVRYAPPSTIVDRLCGVQRLRVQNLPSGSWTLSCYSPGCTACLSRRGFCTARRGETSSMLFQLWPSLHRSRRFQSLLKTRFSAHEKRLRSACTAATRSISRGTFAGGLIHMWRGLPLHEGWRGQRGASERTSRIPGRVGRAYRSGHWMRVVVPSKTRAPIALSPEALTESPERYGRARGKGIASPRGSRASRARQGATSLLRIGAPRSVWILLHHPAHTLADRPFQLRDIPRPDLMEAVARIVVRMPR